MKAAFKGKITSMETFVKDFQESPIRYTELSVEIETLKEMKVKFEELQEQNFNPPAKCKDRFKRN